MQKKKQQPRKEGSACGTQKKSIRSASAVRQKTTTKTNKERKMRHKKKEKLRQEKGTP